MRTQLLLCVFVALSACSCAPIEHPMSPKQVEQLITKQHVEIKTNVGNVAESVAEVRKSQQAEYTQQQQQLSMLQEIQDTLFAIQNMVAPSQTTVDVTPEAESEAEESTCDQSTIKENEDLPTYELPGFSYDLPHVPTSPNLVVIDGVSYDPAAFIALHYVRDWTYPGNLDLHLREHGLTDSQIKSMSFRTREKLHSAIHEREAKTKTKTVQRVSSATVRNTWPTVPPSTLTPIAPQVPYSSRQVFRSSCPNGKCPTYYQSTTRYRVKRR